MQARYWHLLLFTVAILISSAGSFAQAVDGSVVGAILCGVHLTPPPVLTATWKTTVVQRRGKSLVVTNVHTLKAAWDNTGRIYRETHWVNWTDGKAGSDVASVSVSDGSVLIKWQPGSGQATVFHAAQQPPLPPETKEHSETEPDCRLLPPLRPATPENGVGQLAPKTLLGSEAVGTRVKFVKPAAPGSTAPGVNVVEDSWSWTWKNPPVEVLRILRYPDGGYEKSELVAFEDGAPDSMLFQVPEGYAVRDVYPGAQPPGSKRR